MAEFVYYIFNIAVFLPVLMLSVFGKVKIHNKKANFARAYAFVSIPFVLWDIWAAMEGHWYFSNTYITQFRVAGLPVEEILFFLTVPFAMTYVWYVMGYYVSQTPKMYVRYIKRALMVAGLLCIFLSAYNWSLAYTRWAFLAAGITCFMLVRARSLHTKQFVIFQGVLLLLFIFFNSYLTALPVILYGQQSYLNFRVGTIPLEDFFFNFALINLFLVAFLQKTGNSTTLKSKR
jgi:lycopene cyclase domain-containing protein